MESRLGVRASGQRSGSGHRHRHGRLAAALLWGALVAAWAPGASADFYRWVDKNGVEHYSNVPTQLPADREVERMPMEPVSDFDSARPGGTRADDEGVGAGEPSDGSRTANEAVEADLASDALRKDYRKVTARIDAIDAELEKLAAARTRWATQGNPAVGDTRAVGAVDARSPQEEELETERSDLEEQAREMKRSLAELRGKR
jgi:hypothetical protein